MPRIQGHVDNIARLYRVTACSRTSADVARRILLTSYRWSHRADREMNLILAGRISFTHLIFFDVAHDAGLKCRACVRAFFFFGSLSVVSCLVLSRRTQGHSWCRDTSTPRAFQGMVRQPTMDIHDVGSHLGSPAVTASAHTAIREGYTVCGRNQPLRFVRVLTGAHVSHESCVGVMCLSTFQRMKTEW
ncbi:hypothetical protein EDB92DRAFT_904721 [Lactarius akahatsu]|uniref:Uncharacterized protein n=1 Tax=Lactarius akahatsu TaxID=416441 RepID=A0AAD4QCI7_9AGAM|nr:hypothetical protein EDB92DRAFT_904721 [Lactarius akahatsu]